MLDVYFVMLDDKPWVIGALVWIGSDYFQILSGLIVLGCLKIIQVELKSIIYEGGIRVPMIASYPAK